MKVRGYYVTHIDVEVHPNEAYQTLHDSMLNAADLPVGAYLSEDKTKVMVTETYHTSHSWVRK